MSQAIDQGMHSYEPAAAFHRKDDVVGAPSSLRPAGIVEACPATVDRGAVVLLLGGIAACGLAMWMALSAGTPLNSGRLQPGVSVPMFAGPALRLTLERHMQDYHAALGAVRFQAARGQLHAARATAIALLAKAPADTYAWAALAEIQWRLDGGPASEPSLRVRRYLAMSRLTGRYEHTAVRIRTYVGLALWDGLGAPERSRTLADVETLLAAEPKHRIIAHLADVVAGLGQGIEPIVRAEIERLAPNWIKTFDAALRKRRKV